MCLYCNMGDFEFRHNPPWHPQQYPVWPTSVPLPVYPLQPIVPWDLAKLREYHDLLKAMSVPEDAPAIQIDEMRHSFFAGAQHLFASIMGILEPGAEPTDKDLKRMDLIHEELNRFIEQYKLRNAQTKGTA